jgi:uroporphyrinogen-III synthase
MALSNQTILVTRSNQQASEFSKLLEGKGAMVVEMPTLEISPPSSWSAFDRAITELESFDWLILTSANAVTFFFDRLIALGKDLHDIPTVKIAVVGDKTAQWLGDRGFIPDFIPPEFVADALVEHFPEPVAGLKLLFPRVESGGREILVQGFTTLGGEIVEVAAYQSICPGEIDPGALEPLQTQQITMVTFTSGKTVRHFCHLLEGAVGDNWQQLLETVKVCSIGPQTSKLCQELIGRVDLEAVEYTLEGLLCAMEKDCDRGMA